MRVDKTKAGWRLFEQEANAPSFGDIYLCDGVVCFQKHFKDSLTLDQMLDITKLMVEFEKQSDDPYVVFRVEKQGNLFKGWRVFQRERLLGKIWMEDNLAVWEQDENCAPMDLGYWRPLIKLMEEMQDEINQLPG